MYVGVHQRIRPSAGSQDMMSHTVLEKSPQTRWPQTNGRFCSFARYFFFVFPMCLNWSLILLDGNWSLDFGSDPYRSVKMFNYLLLLWGTDMFLGVLTVGSQLFCRGCSNRASHRMLLRLPQTSFNRPFGFTLLGDCATMTTDSKWYTLYIFFGQWHVMNGSHCSRFWCFCHDSVLFDLLVFAITVFYMEQLTRLYQSRLIVTFLVTSGRRSGHFAVQHFKIWRYSSMFGWFCVHFWPFLADFTLRSLCTNLLKKHSSKPPCNLPFPAMAPMKSMKAMKAMDTVNLMFSQRCIVLHSIPCPQ